MANFTIDEFWRARLKNIRKPEASPVKGWSLRSNPLETFQEAPMSHNAELSSADPLESPLLLVSAPGAVGKTTLARQIASETGAILVDLAQADPVGGNTMSGGLAKSGLYSSWEAEETALLIDGLDEARLRVTQEAFEAFLVDVADLTKHRKMPTILFGRTGSIQDAWVPLQEQGAPFSILEIGFYGPEASVAFAVARLRAKKSDATHAEVETKAVALLLERLREEASSDGDRFAGYAPVLQAVADRVAGEDNAASLIAQIEKGERPVTLQSVVNSILERERSKLNGLPLEDSSVLATLYSPSEQLERLVARVYGLEPPPVTGLSPQDAQAYAAALETWLPEHPFLDGGMSASSAVFEAVIVVEALRSRGAAGAAVARELARGSAANPFIAEFYVGDEPETQARELPAEHIGIVYTSLRARLSFGDYASLQVEGFEDAEEEEALRAEVEIFVSRSDAQRARILTFDSEQVGTILLGKYLEDIEINAEYARVEIGTGSEALLVAPIVVHCDQLRLNADKVIVERSRGGDDENVFMEAHSYDGPLLTTQPVLRGSPNLSVAWPNAQSHPWTAYAAEPTPSENPLVDEGLRRFRKFITAFRSHSKGNLARYRHKLEHDRMTKGTGQKVLNALIDQKAIALDGEMYYLDPKRLGEVSGATYADAVARRFSDKTIAFVRSAIEK